MIDQQMKIWKNRPRVKSADQKLPYCIDRSKVKPTDQNLDQLIKKPIVRLIVCQIKS